MWGEKLPRPKIDGNTLNYLETCPHIYRALSGDWKFPHLDGISEGQGIVVYAYIDPMEAMQQVITGDSERTFLAIEHERYLPCMRTEGTDNRLILGNHLFEIDTIHIKNQDDFRKHIPQTKDFKKQLEFFLKHYVTFNASLDQYP